MRIHCPISDADDVGVLAGAGADTFYAGVSSEVMFGTSCGTPNRRPWKSANFSSLDDLIRACASVHSFGKKIALTINEHFYSQEQIGRILEFVGRSSDFIDAFIVSDLGLILELREAYPEVRIVASTGAHVQNKESIRFFRDLGVGQIVIPRHFTLEEIRRMTEAYPDVVFECFIRRGDCPNVDGFCRFVHGVFDADKAENACTSLSNFTVDARDVADFGRGNLTIEDVSKKINGDFNEMMIGGCGICALWDLSRMNVGAAKIVGREAPLKRRALDTLFTKSALDRVHLPKDEYLKSIRTIHEKIFARKCDRRCLYRIR